MATHVLLAALTAVLIHALVHGAPQGLPTSLPYQPPFDYDYSADVEAQEAMLVEATTTAAMIPPRDPLADAREMAKLNIMDRILIALGPPFGEKLPKAPTSDTLATVPTPINITTEPCPYKYKRCSSQTYFPSCALPRNTDPVIWPQRFNLFFNLSEDFDTKLDIINATLRLYKNNSLPLQRAKTLLIKAYVYTRSLTRRRNKTKLVADTQVSSDYLGWVTLSVSEIVKRWKKQKSNHGVLITVNDVDDTPWDGQRIFVTMDCDSGQLPLPFEVQTEDGQQYPALNVRLGSPDDEPEAALESSSPPPFSLPISDITLFPPSPTMQGDDPASLYDYNYESDLEEEENKEREIEGIEDNEEEQQPQEAQEMLDVISARSLHAFHDNPAHARSLNMPQEETLIPPALVYQHHDQHTHAHQPTPHSTPSLPQTTPLSRPQEHTTAIPSPTPPVVSVRGPSRRRGGPRDMRHRRKHRGGHRRG